MRAIDVMQKGVATVSPELSVQDFEEFLTGEDISGAPVVTLNGELVGIASKTDIVRALSEVAYQAGEDLYQQRLTVEEIMSREVVTVSPQAPIKEVAAIMLEGRLHRVIVADDDHILGIITPFDLLALLT